jgi:cardiolipin synthase C
MDAHPGAQIIDVGMFPMFRPAKGAQFAKVLLCLCLSSFAACTQLQPRPEMIDVQALPPGEDSPLDRATTGAEAQYPGQSAFRLVVEGVEAFAVRAQSARMAQRSLDVQTYIWHADLTGLFFAHELLEAAERGVRVRLLLDDMDARAKNAGLAALAAHPNVDVRLFNPFASRSGALGFISEGVRSFGRINRRMHNKSWIADNRLAVVGGRNIGDEYFSASDEVNFFDLDFAMIGPVVRDASASFDKYWNSPSAYPMEVLDAEAVSQPALDKLRSSLAARSEEAESSPYAETLRNDDAIKRIIDGDWPLHWAANYRFVSDDPLKVGMKEQDAQSSRVGAALLRLAQSTQRDMTVISPYFVPGESGTRLLTDTAGAGRSVRVLTNSLAANDVAAVHGGYSRYRKPLLTGGVQLWELKPLADQEAQSSLFGSSGASLHTKALFVDGTILFVGSYNLDPRSTWLNCEQGVLVENATLALQLDGIFARHIADGAAWQVTLADDALKWNDGRESFDSDPDASAGRRFQAWLTRVLGLEAQL